MNQALLGKQAGRNTSLGDPRGAGKTRVVFPSTAQGQGLWGQAGICVSPFGLPDTKVPPSSLAVYLISLGFRWLLVEWSVPNYIIGCIVS